VSDRARRLPWVLWAASMLLLAATLTLTVSNWRYEEDGWTFIPLAVAMVFGYATVGALLASRNPGNLIGWLMMLAAGLFVTSGFTGEYATYHYLTNPGTLPFALAAAWISNWVIIPFVVTPPMLLILFPTGRPVARWRFLPPALAAAGAVTTIVVILRPGVLSPAPGITVRNPTGIAGVEAVFTPIVWIAGFAILLGGVGAIAALVVRFRRAQGEERQQIRWLAYVAGIAGVFLLTTILTSIGIKPNQTRAINDLSFILFFASIGIGIPVAAGIAILKYRLYDLDIVVKKTLVFAILVICMTAVGLVAIAVIGGLLVGPVSDHPVALLAAGVAVGLLFTPLRRLASGIADRVVYGGRATPYEILTEFSGRMAETYSADDVLARTAGILGEGIGAGRATVWLRVGRELRAAAVWPDGAPPPPAVMSGDELPSFPGEHAVEVRHQGELLGALSVEMPPSDPMNLATAKLVRDLAGQAGLVLRNVRLIEELRSSRKRIVAAQDERARALERNIHDGAQQQLVALAVKLRLAQSLTTKDPAKAEAMLAELQLEAGEALENLRDLARGIYPPLLADKGLPEALAAQARKSPIPMHVETDHVSRYPQEIESTVYFCCLEAIQNAVRHSGASHVSLTLAATEERLRFEVSDDGAGFDPAASGRGTGLQGMADRLEAIGGTLEVRSSPGAGASVAGTVPISSP
jgi:signal transduction histidine kinase